MCWSADVSLKTFLQGAIFIGIIYLLNPDDIIIIVFLASFLAMQLLEYFIWTNIKNRGNLRFYGFLTYLLIFIQPILLLYVTQNYKYILLYVALQLFWLIFCLISFNDMKFNFLPYVGKNRHLVWNWTNNNMYEIVFGIIYLIFYLSTIYIYTSLIVFIAGVMTYLYSIYNYWNFKTSSTMWCWIVSMLIAAYLIIAIYKFDVKTNRFIRYFYK